MRWVIGEPGDAPVAGVGDGHLHETSETDRARIARELGLEAAPSARDPLADTGGDHPPRVRDKRYRVILGAAFVAVVVTFSVLAVLLRGAPDGATETRMIHGSGEAGSTQQTREPGSTVASNEAPETSDSSTAETNPDSSVPIESVPAGCVQRTSADLDPSRPHSQRVVQLSVSDVAMQASTTQTLPPKSTTLVITTTIV